MRAEIVHHHQITRFQQPRKRITDVQCTGWGALRGLITNLRKSAIGWVATVNLLASGYASFRLETRDADPYSIAPFSKDILFEEGSPHMSAQTRLFLLITPPGRPFGPIGAACVIIGSTDRMRGLEVELSSTIELEVKMENAGLPEYEIHRAIQRLRMNYPTIREISYEAAESLGLIKRSGDVAGSSGRNVGHR